MYAIDPNSLYDGVKDVLIKLGWKIKKMKRAEYIEANYGSLFGTGVPALIKFWISNSDVGSKMKVEITSRGWKFGALVRKELNGMLEGILAELEHSLGTSRFTEEYVRKLLEKLDERLALGEISEKTYWELRRKYESMLSK